MSSKNRPLAGTLLTSLLCLSLSSLLAAPLAADGAGYRKDLLADLKSLEDKIVGLAEAIPEEKYSWAPGEGVRTVSQAIMHTAAANYFFPTLMGGSMPEGINPRGFEQITDKATVVKTAKESFAHLRGTIEAATDEQLDSTVNAFGQEMTGAGFLHFAVSHNHEHLGQLIAYARSNSVTPPWSE
jgi:uncharacterized damage-inducible protein DinB